MLIFICQVLGTIDRYWTKVAVGEQVQSSENIGTVVGFSAIHRFRRLIVKWNPGTDKDLVLCRRLSTAAQRSPATIKGGYRARFTCASAGDAKRSLICRLQDRHLTYCEVEALNSLPICDKEYLEQVGLGSSGRRKALESSEYQPSTSKETYYTYTTDEPRTKISLLIRTTKRGLKSVFRLKNCGLRNR